MLKDGLIQTTKVTSGVYYVEIPAADFRLLCGCPADVVKHLIDAGLIAPVQVGGVACESGPNAILLSDVGVQSESFANMAEFPVLQMLYRQGTLIPGHPNNTGKKPLLIGDSRELRAQLNYIHRGNYGLLSKDEMALFGASEQLAEALMQIKLKFAFGTIRESRELLDVAPLDREPVLLSSGVGICRLDVNRFEVEFRGEKTLIDLNLKAGESYSHTATLTPRKIQRAYFSVVHCGEGDGWDPRRPSMSSILTFKGKIFLLDAGPAVLASLKACGIALNEVEGIFHTHSHDDHFAGLPDLMRTDRRLKYFAHPLIRGSVAKKLASLLCVDDAEMAYYFDFYDLKIDEWNDIDGLEVKPVLSPHPVETTIFLFRTQVEGGYKTYSHLADIASLGLLDGFSESLSGVAKGCGPLIERAKAAYTEPASLKKIDIGGGMIHGRAEDFAQDRSEKIILAHLAGELTSAQSRIGQRAQFGDQDLLIEGYENYALARAEGFLKSDFPLLSDDERSLLLAHTIKDYEPGAVLIAEGSFAGYVFLLLHGCVNKTSTTHDAREFLSPGALLGELPVLLNQPSFYTYTAASYITVLAVPSDFYRAFIKDNGLETEIERIQEPWRFLATSSLFGEGLSHETLSHLVRSSETLEVDRGHGVDLSLIDDVFLIEEGVAQYQITKDHQVTLRAGAFFCGAGFLGDTTPKESIVYTEPSRVIRLAGAEVKRIPVCRWKLIEASRRRLYGRS